MSIPNLQQIIAARERQMGGRMTEPKEEKPQERSEEVVEIMKLLFEFVRQQVGQINNDINIIKQQQQKILDKLEDKSNE